MRISKGSCHSRILRKTNVHLPQLLCFVVSAAQNVITVNAKPKLKFAMINRSMGDKIMTELGVELSLS